MNDTLQTLANIAQIASLFIAFIALVIQTITWVRPNAPNFDPILRRIRFVLPFLPYIGIGGFFFALGSCAATPSARLVNDMQATNTSMRATIAALEARPPLIVNAPTITTAQDLPTANANPNSTTSVVETQIPQPTNNPVLVFSDNFNQGLLPNWTIIAGDWLVINDKLSAVRFEFLPSAGNVAQISVGNTDWANYNIDFEADNFIDSFGSKNYLVLRVKFQDMDNHVFFRIDRRAAICGVRRNGEESVLPRVTLDKTTAKIRINTADNKYELFIDGEPICSFRENSFASGTILIETNSYINDTVNLDNFLVTTP